MTLEPSTAGVHILVTPRMKARAAMLEQFAALLKTDEDHRGDVEAIHIEADDALIAYIALDDPELAEAYKRLPRYFA